MSEMEENLSSIGVEESECSWTEADDYGSPYSDIQQRLQSFVSAGHESEFFTQNLDSRQRRVVHGMAHIMHLGHESVKSDGQRLRRMRIFKSIDDGSLMSALDDHTGVMLQDYGLFFAGDPVLPASSSHDAASHLEVSVEDTSATPSRLPKIEGGFPCRYPLCHKVYDRACDRRKHEKRHDSKDSYPHQCSECDKAFLCPKDVRRHAKVHERQITFDGARDALESTSQFSPLTHMRNPAREINLTLKVEDEEDSSGDETLCDFEFGSSSRSSPMLVSFMEPEKCEQFPLHFTSGLLRLSQDAMALSALENAICGLRELSVGAGAAAFGGFDMG